MIMKYLTHGILVAISVLFIGCHSVPKTGRSSLSLVSENKLAAAASLQFDQFKRQMRISRNPDHNERVQRVGQRIADVASADIPNAHWEFVVFDDDQVNAFAMPGGKVAVYTGLLKIAETDDELAIVIGHEVAHVAARHSNERYSQKVLKSGLLSVGSIALQVGTGLGSFQQDAILIAVGAAAEGGIILPFSRRHESEADEIGLLYAAEAGYDPHAAITFWERMEALKEESSPGFLSTHPSGDTRIRKLWVQMPEALEIYRNR